MRPDAAAPQPNSGQQHGGRGNADSAAIAIAGALLRPGTQSAEWKSGAGRAIQAALERISFASGRAG